MYLSAEEEALSLLQVASQRELAVFALFDGLEMWPARGLDGVNELRRSGTGQERGRDGEAEVLLHNAAAGPDRSVSE